MKQITLNSWKEKRRQFRNEDYRNFLPCRLVELTFESLRTSLAAAVFCCIFSLILGSVCLALLLLLLSFD